MSKSKINSTPFVLVAVVAALGAFAALNSFATPVSAIIGPEEPNGNNNNGENNNIDNGAVNNIDNGAVGDIIGPDIPK